MKSTSRPRQRTAVPAVFFAAVLVVLSALGAGGLAAVQSGPAGAASPGPGPWTLSEPASVGGLVLYNAAGDVITGGSTSDQPFAAFVEGTSTLHAGNTKATVSGFLPVSGEQPNAWSGEQLGESTVYPATGAPSPVSSSTLPVNTGEAGDESIATLAADLPNTDTSSDGYAGVYELRLQTSAVGQSLTTNYDSVYIQITGSTWSVVYPTANTTTSVVASPATTSTQGTSVTLTATVTTAATGTVQFYVGAAALGTPVAVSDGTASDTTSSLPVGNDTITANFLPTTNSGYAGSTGSIPYLVTSSTTTTLTASPTSPQAAGTSVTLTATIAPSQAAGTVQFEIGGTAFGSPATVTAGAASLVTTALPVGTDVLTAVFTPSSSTYTGSTSNQLSYVISPVATTTVLTATPSGTQQFGGSVTLHASVTPVAATGSVQFEVGGSDIGSPAAVSAGTASLVTTALPAGTDSLTAVFTPTADNGYSGSTSTPVSYSITNVATTTTLTATPPSPQQEGTSVTLHAAISPAAATGTVQFEVGGTAFGTPQTVTSGVATLTTTALPAGTNAVTAVFTSTSGNGYASSSSSSLSYDITAIPTTTVLATPTPASPQPFGTSVSLSATVSPAASGTVQFKVGTTAIGSPVTVTAGAASTSTSTLPVGTDSITAVFTPTAGNGYSPSTSAPVSYQITAIPTTTVLATPTPASPQPFGTSVSLSATVSPAASGTVQFEVGTTAIGSPVTVTAGAASTSTSTLPVGTDSLTAVFTPTAGSNYASSTSTAVSYVIQAIPTSTVLATPTPASPQFAGTPVTLTATVSPATTGSVEFKSGSTVIGTASVSSGSATLTTSTLPVGIDSLTSVFTPTVGTGHLGSTSSAVPYTVVALTPTTTSLSVSPVSPQPYGTTITLTATVTPSASGSIQFRSGSTVLATVVLTSGTAKTNQVLPGGTNSLTAVYVPTAGNGFLASTSVPVSFSTGHTGKGYWLVSSTGTVAHFGNAGANGSLTSPPNLPIVGSASTPDGKGYWLVASDGGVFAFGDAGFFGSTGNIHLNKPIVGIASTPDGKGYWLVASDGGVFAFGDAGFHGSTGNIVLNKPIVGIASTPDGKGYWLVASDGGIFAFGDAGFHGSTGNIVLNKPIVGVTSTPDGKGYWLVASDGGIFAFGDAGYFGSGAGSGQTIVGIAGS